VFQASAIVMESIRLVMVQKLLSSPEYKMDPLVSLYYFAPVFPCRDNPDVSFVPP